MSSKIKQSPNWLCIVEYEACPNLWRSSQGFTALLCFITMSHWQAPVIRLLPVKNIGFSRRSSPRHTFKSSRLCSKSNKPASLVCIQGMHVYSKTCFFYLCRYFKQFSCKTCFLWNDTRMQNEEIAQCLCGKTGATWQQFSTLSMKWEPC